MLASFRATHHGIDRDLLENAHLALIARGLPRVLLLRCQLMFGLSLILHVDQLEEKGILLSHVGHHILHNHASCLLDPPENVQLPWCIRLPSEVLPNIYILFHTMLELAF